MKNNELWINYYLAIRCPEDKVNEVRNIIKEKVFIIWDKPTFGKYILVPNSQPSGSGINEEE